MEQGVTEKGHFREAKCKDSGGSYKVGTNLLYNDTILCVDFIKARVLSLNSNLTPLLYR